MGGRWIAATVAAGILAAWATAGAFAHPAAKHPAGELKTPLLHEIRFYRGETQSFLRQMGKPRFAVAHAEVTRPEWRPWIRDLWKGRYVEARAELAKWLRSYGRLENNWHAALLAASQRFGVSFSWLHACNHGEGGHNRYADNPISDATGYMQFMPGTFYGHSGRALQAAGIPGRFNDIFSAIGQAFTAAHMFSRGLSSHWVGNGC